MIGLFFLKYDNRIKYDRAAPILPAKFLEKQEAKSKEQNSREIGEILGNGCLRTVTWPILHCKDGNILTEWS